MNPNGLESGKDFNIMSDEDTMLEYYPTET